MRNLAGDTYADASIKDELSAIGAEIVTLAADERRGEVPATVGGRIGPFTFRRLWYYWTVRGTVPHAIAEGMFHDPIGRRDVRVRGFAGNTEPDGDVCSYHIDTAAGLRLFVDTVRRHGLDRMPGAAAPASDD
jgi:hypothetical protein